MRLGVLFRQLLELLQVRRGVAAAGQPRDVLQSQLGGARWQGDVVLDMAVRATRTLRHRSCSPLYAL